MFRQEYPFSIYVQWIRQFPDTPVIRCLGFANAEVLVPLTPDGFKQVQQTKCYDFGRSRMRLRIVLEFAGWGIVTFDGASPICHRTNEIIRLHQNVLSNRT